MFLAVSSAANNSTGPVTATTSRRQLVLWAIVFFFLFCCRTPAQQIMGESGAGDDVRLIQTDLAALELDENRKDLPCNVTPVRKATLGFDLHMHAGYGVTIPLRELAGDGNRLTIIFRVTPQQESAQPVFFTQYFRVPPIEADARGETYLEGSFDMGEGVYKVDWLMRDVSERLCTYHWEVEATLPERDKDIALTLAPGEVAVSRYEVFEEDQPVTRASPDNGINVKVLVNFAPPNPNAAVLQPLDRNALLSIVRNIARDPRISKFTLVAFNLQERRVIFRQDEASRIDYEGLRAALESLNLGTIDVGRLSQRNGEALFLAELLQREVTEAKGVDAIVFAGPKALLSQNVSSEDLRKIGPLPFPLFYLNYNLFPEVIPWRDAIGNVVRFFKGTEYTITRPRDMWRAVGEMISRIWQNKNERQQLASGELK